MTNLPVIQSSGRCTGHCCKRFPLGGDGKFFDGSPMEMNRVYDSGPDGPNLVDMLLPFHGPVKFEGDVTRFTCRHFVDDSCTNYAGRPALCKKHGTTDHLCPEEECTLSVKITKQILVYGVGYGDTAKEVAA